SDSGADGAAGVVAGTAGSSASTTACDCAPPGEKAPCTCIWVAAADSVLGEAEPLRGRRAGPRSAFIRPTRLSPSPPPLAAGLERSISSVLSGAGDPASPCGVGASG